MSDFYYPLLIVVVVFGISSFLIRLWHRSRPMETGQQKRKLDE